MPGFSTQSAPCRVSYDQGEETGHGKTPNWPHVWWTGRGSLCPTVETIFPPGHDHPSVRLSWRPSCPRTPLPARVEISLAKRPTVLTTLLPRQFLNQGDQREEQGDHDEADHHTQHNNQDRLKQAQKAFCDDSHLFIVVVGDLV